MREINDELLADFVICTVGGGGLISGLLNYVNDSKLDTIIMGAEPENIASMYESLKNKKRVILNTNDVFVDGACVKQIGTIPFDVCSKSEINIYKIPNGKVCNDMIQIYQNDGIITEPAGILPISSLDYIDKELIKNKNVVCIISGGNNDISRYQEIMSKSLEYNGIKHYFIVNFTQKGGELKKFMNNIIMDDADITRFEYIKKSNKEKGSVLIGIELLNNNICIDIIIERMKNNNFSYYKLSENDLIYDLIV